MDKDLELASLAKERELSPSQQEFIENINQSIMGAWKRIISGRDTHEGWPEGFTDIGIWGNNDEWLNR